MRFREILNESNSEEIQNSIMDILVTIIASGVDEVETESLIDMLQGMGINISSEALKGELETIPMVYSVSDDIIRLGEQDPKTSIGNDSDVDFSKEKVSSMAADEAKDSINHG